MIPIRLNFILICTVLMSWCAQAACTRAHMHGDVSRTDAIEVFVVVAESLISSIEVFFNLRDGDFVMYPPPLQKSILPISFS